MITENITIDTGDVSAIPERDLPLLVFSDNMRSFLSFGIKAHQKGAYNHFMWMVHPEKFVSQGWILKEEDAAEYLKGWHRLKFVSGRHWSDMDKRAIKSSLFNDLKRPWHKKLYDPLQIIGIAIGLKQLQLPGKIRICSDYAALLALSDGGYQMEHPSPTQVNEYTKKNSDKYQVYMRYIPD